MSERNVCAYCKKDLTTIEEIHVVEGYNFCSKDCAVSHQAEIISASAYDTATEWYNGGVEIVTPVDIGIVHEKILTPYDAKLDLTTIFLAKYLDKECTEAISFEVIGFYFGEPNETDTETFRGNMKAMY